MRNELKMEEKAFNGVVGERENVHSGGKEHTLQPGHASWHQQNTSTSIGTSDLYYKIEGKASGGEGRENGSGDRLVSVYSAQCQNSTARDTVTGSGKRQ